MRFIAGLMLNRIEVLEKRNKTVIKNSNGGTKVMQLFK
jgi:hypothetical protein